MLAGCGSNGSAANEDDAAHPALIGKQAAAQAADKHPAKKPSPVSFNHDIRPILSENCFFCHGPDPKHREADVRIDIFEAATEDLGGYAAIVPGDRETSELWIRVKDKATPMPPKKSHKKLKPEEIELIGRWIDEGAKYETHWAYEKPTRPQPPAQLSDQSWPKGAVDRFILAKLDAQSIAPSPQATKRQLLRRVTFDLTGLPPTPQQTASFMNDTSPDAYEKYVDSLMKTHAYGEHLAVWWLDLVRYADSKGFHGDQDRTAWPYRDWVVKSFNENMPFDEFTKLQLAGDLMQDQPTREMLVASAYNRLSPQTEEGGAQHKEYEAIYNADRVANFADVWLGSSVACAQCHDHKFDPFTAEDFYSMAAFFSDINQQIIGHRSGYARHAPPYTFVPQDDAQAEKIKAHEKLYNAFIKEHPTAMVLEEKLTSRDYKSPLPQADPNEKELEAKLKKILEERTKLANQVPTLITTRALETPRVVRVLNRGNWQDEAGKVVQPATPSFLGGPASEEGNRLTRLDLAKWVSAPDNPLPARVVANRLWGKYLGSAISSNTVELGSQGIPPTHPELLDYLAIEFRESGWDIQHMIRMIVTSQTYKQSANVRTDLAIVDPNNTKLFARQTAIRLPAEAVRDLALSVSGLMKPRTAGGPSVFPYQPDGHWEPLNFPRRPYPTSKGDDLYRRGLYTWMQRTFPHPMMVNFDAPSRETCTGQRMASTTPLQALTTLNAPIFVESARYLAQRLISEDKDDAKRLERLYELVLARTPRDTERNTLLTLLAQQRKHFAALPDQAKALSSTGQAPAAAKDLDPVEVAAWTSLCRVILNLHETITRN